jgi:endogenous inhibitor of DNA gyrase (YacG/DUF329 family)
MDHKERDTEGNARSSARPCPICGKPASLDARPFCSKRCADIDLHHWLSGSYAVPAKPDADEESAAPDDQGPERK